MTRKTALRRMLGGQRVYRSDYPDTMFRYDESKEKNGEQAIRVIHKGKELGGTLAFFFLPNLGWKEYRPEEQCQNQEQLS